jgi:drug/metabolite transporter (DMT)-like permease
MGWATLAVTIFAGWFVATRFAVTHSLRVWDVVALRFGVGAALLIPVLLRSHGSLRRRDWIQALWFALLWGAPFVLMVAFGLRLTSITLASSITPAMMPVFAGLIGWAALREAPGRARLTGYAAIVVGLVGLTASNATGALSFNPPGILCLVLAALSWAIYTLWFRRSQLTALQSAALICVWSSALYLPAYILFGLSRITGASASELLVQTTYQGVCMSVVALVAFNRAIAIPGSRAAAAIMASVPVMATLLAAPILGERPSLPAVVAIAIIALGVIMAAMAAPVTPVVHSSHTHPANKDAPS